jgi:hypothetical protein
MRRQHSARILLTALLGGFAAPAADSAVFNSPPDPVPASLASGDVLNIGAGATTLRNFTADAGSLINVNGGTVESDNIIHADANVNSGLFRPFQVTGVVNLYYGMAGGSMAFRNELNVYGGTVGSASHLGPGAVLNLFDGLVRGSMNISDAEVNVFGGSMEVPTPALNANVNVYGGAYSNGALFGNSVMNISGGTLLDPDLALGAGSKANIYGSLFLLDNAPIQGLSFGNPVVISARDVVLSGTLLDGSSITLNLATGMPFSSVDPTAIVTVFLIPEVSTVTALLIGGVFIGAMRKTNRR